MRGRESLFGCIFRKLFPIWFLVFAVLSAGFTVPQAMASPSLNGQLGADPPTAAAAGTKGIEEKATPILLNGTVTETWTQLPITNTPPARIDHAMAYDADSQKVILFGGYDSNYNLLDDTWAFDIVTGDWTNLSSTITTSTPPARCFHAMASTPTGILLFGGEDTFNHVLGDTWIFRPNTNRWDELDLSITTTRPSARSYQAMASTPSGAILFGGSPDNYTALGDTWAFDAATGHWSQLTDTGTPPSPRYNHVMAYDASSQQVILYGGENETDYLEDTWAFDIATGLWTPIPAGTTPSASCLDYFAMAYDPGSQKEILFGGIYYATPHQDTWVFDSAVSNWSQLTVHATPPARYHHAMASTSTGLILFGGRNMPGDAYFLFDDTWAFSGGVSGMPSIDLTAPIGGEKWGIGTSQPITYTCKDLTGPVTIELSRDNGTTWESLTTTATGGTGSFSFPWTVSGPGTINAEVRVSAAGCDPSISYLLEIAEEKGPYSGTFTATFSDGQVTVRGG